MNINATVRKILGGLIFVISLFTMVDSYAWHGGYHGGGRYYHGGYHGGGNWGWGHRGYGYGWRGVGYRSNCVWVGAHRNRWGGWIPGRRVCR